ncbi:YncE family protein, partial [Streptomyces sp. NPDC059499]|uniref:YncE family protein n=1 Tax=Streptomyces sp. NPDC059499 TaxID=3346852 RepID=UPI0036C8B4A7
MSVRRAVPAVAAALLLAGCATGTQTSADAPRPTLEVGAAQERTPHGTLLVADFGGDTVTFVDPGRGRGAGPDGSVEAGTAPYGLTVGEDGRAWVATAEGVAVIDTATRTRLDVIPYATESGPVTTGEYRGGGMGIALAPDGAHVYVGVNVPGGNGVLEVIDTATREVTATVPVGRRPY